MGPHVRRCLQHMRLPASRTEPPLSLRGLLLPSRSMNIHAYWSFSSSHGISASCGPCLWIVAAQGSLGSGCVAPNPCVSFRGIIMEMKQYSLWLSTALWGLSFMFFYHTGLIWWTTRSQNAEPECCDDLHWDLWGIGHHGNGLLCLLVS